MSEEVVGGCRKALSRVKVWNVEVSGWDDVVAEEGERGSNMATMLTGQPWKKGQNLDAKKASRYLRS